MRLFKNIFHDLHSSSNGRSVAVKRNASTSLLIKILAMIIQFIQVPIVLSYLSPSTYGVYLTISSIVMWTHNFDLGLGQGLRYKLTKAISLNKTKEAKELVSTAYYSLGAIMTTSMFILIPICFIINWQSFFNFSEESNERIALCVSIVLLSFLLKFILELISVVLQANQRTAISTIFTPIANLISVIGVIILKGFSEDSLLLACIMLALPQTLVLLVVNIYLFNYTYKEISPNIRSYKREHLKGIYNLGLKFFISSLASLVVFNSSNILLTNMINPTEAAVYQTAFMYMGIIVTFMGVLSSPLTAGITDAYVKQDFSWLKNSYKYFRKITLMGSVGCVILLLISPIVYKIWIGEKLIIPFSVSLFLSLYFIGNLWSSMFNCYVIGAGKAFISMIMGIPKIIFFIPIAAILIKNIGVIGLIIATIVVNTLPNIILYHIQSKKIISNSLHGIWLR